MEINFYWAPYADDDRNREEFPIPKMTLENLSFDTTVDTLKGKVGDLLGMNKSSLYVCGVTKRSNTRRGLCV